jgi:uncharacterized paraquat-inducible protein A
MGTWSKFDCKKCGYTVNVSGGKDFGMVAVVQTMICNDCKELVDVLIGRCGETGKSGDIEYDKDLDVCPECRGTNLSTWSASTRSCPRCRQKLNKGQVVAMWD